MASATTGETTTERSSTKNKKFTQSRVFEFLPNTEIAPHEVVELTSIVRIGVSGEKIASMSPGLQKYFVEIKK